MGSRMHRLLYVRASIFGGDGRSSQLAEALLERYRSIHSDARVVVRDVQNPPLPHLDAATFTTFAKPAAALTVADHDRLRLSDELIGELQGADDLLIGMPMYNFGVPSAFKAWIDHVTRINKTFKAGPTGSEGQLGNIRHCWIVAARGGQYADTPRENQVPYLTTMLGFLGVAAPRFVFAEAMLRPDLRDASLDKARHTIEQLEL
jgi:FMN-dependent NADH-azoreductase